MHSTDARCSSKSRFDPFCDAAAAAATLSGVRLMHSERCEIVDNGTVKRTRGATHIPKYGRGRGGRRRRAV
eukprot:5682014-Prymnesium_polylepis.1